jgi:hypothetical protein
MKIAELLLEIFDAKHHAVCIVVPFSERDLDLFAIHIDILHFTQSLSQAFDAHCIDVRSIVHMVDGVQVRSAGDDPSGYAVMRTGTVLLRPSRQRRT